jgi:hypothetical protein
VTRKLKTPGGKLVLQYTAKKAKGPQTPVGDQGRIHGVRVARVRPAAGWLDSPTRQRSALCWRPKTYTRAAPLRRARSLASSRLPRACAGAPGLTAVPSAAALRRCRACAPRSTAASACRTTRRLCTARTAAC